MHPIHQGVDTFPWAALVSATAQVERLVGRKDSHVRIEDERVVQPNPLNVGCMY
jgi:hypothetical protein